MADSNEKFFLFNPVEGEFTITDHFNSPRSYANKRHEGLDLRVRTNRRNVFRRILAAQRGTVSRIQTTDKGGYGIYVRLDHDWPDGNRYSTWYGHLSSVEPSLRIGQFVQAGQVVGIGGNTGNSSGPHLHLTVQHHGKGLHGYVVANVIDPTHLIRLEADAALVDQMVFVKDVTVPDGMLIEAGKAFVKTWRVKNLGSTTWKRSYKMKHVDGERMGAGTSEITIPAAKPGEEVEISIPMKAPAKSGLFRSVWRPFNADGESFPFEMYAEVRAFSRASRDDSELVTDITIPDGTIVQQGESFLKTWKVKNTGNTTWKDYTLEYVGDPFSRDNQMGAPLAIDIPFCRPGQTVNISVTLRAPDPVGTHRSTWRLRKRNGGFFGEQLFAEIKVAEKVRPSGTNGLTYIDDVTIQDNTEVQPQQRLTKIWRVRNSGTLPWGEGYVVSNTGGSSMGAPKTIPLPKAQPGQIVHVVIEMEAPAKAGSVFGRWMAKDPDGKIFGQDMTILVNVADLTGKDGYRYVADITVPDHTLLQAGETRKKTWRVRNTGVTTWGEGYTLRHVRDDNLSTVDRIPLPPAEPGQSVDISIDLTAPSSPGEHKTSWKPFNSQNKDFGLELFSIIRVPAPVGPPKKSDARLKQHVTIPNGSKITAGKRFTKEWAISNVGESTWGPGFTLAFMSGVQMEGPKSVPLRVTKPGEAATVRIDFTAPSIAGRYRGLWRLRDPQGNFFGSVMHVFIVAEEDQTVEAEKFDLLPYMKGDSRLYEMKHFFHNGTGQQRVQTQVAGNKFYHVKNQEWEELWSDNNFIYRGTDTSPGSGNFYRLSENGKHGSRWIPRHMAIGQQFRRRPLVTLQRKDNCQKIDNGSGFHETWIKLEQVLDELVLPDVQNRDRRGMRVRNVIVLAGMHAAGAGPGAVFERYYYAQKYGLVMWEGVDTGHNGRSFMVEEHKPGDRPNNNREGLRCGPF